MSSTCATNGSHLSCHSDQTHCPYVLLVPWMMEQTNMPLYVRPEALLTGLDSRMEHVVRVMPQNEWMSIGQYAQSLAVRKSDVFPSARIRITKGLSLQYITDMPRCITLFRWLPASCAPPSRSALAAREQSGLCMCTALPVVLQRFGPKRMLCLCMIIR